MAIAYAGTTGASVGTGTSQALFWPGLPAGQLLIAFFAFEGVAAGSGPYINDTGSSAGWYRVCYQAPAANGGTGLEIWGSFPGWSSGPGTTFNFTGTFTFVAQGAVYTGQLNDNTTSPIRASTTAQVTGNNPQAPAIFALVNELVIAIGAEAMSNPGFGTPTSPSGFTQRWDSNRAGFGTAEQTIADKIAASSASVGPIVWTANGATGASPGATATLAIQPAAAPVGSGAPLIEITFPVG